MVTVYVWSPKMPDNPVGHAAIEVAGQYYSFWPAAAVPKSRMTSDVKSWFPQWTDDLANEKGPLHKVGLKKLDENAMLVFLQRLKVKAKGYNMKHFNCSHPVKVALYEGSGRISPNFKVHADASQYDFHGMLPSSGYKAIDQKIEAFVRDTWNPLDVKRYAEYLRKVVG